LIVLVLEVISISQTLFAVVQQQNAAMPKSLHQHDDTIAITLHQPWH